MEIIIDASCSDEELNLIARAAEACNTSLRAQIARNDQLIAQSKYRLISRQMEDCPE